MNMTDIDTRHIFRTMAARVLYHHRRPKEAKDLKAKRKARR